MPLIPKNQPPYYTISDTPGNGIKQYTALLTQTGTDAPAAIILQNTIGEIIWTRNSMGNYIGTLNGAFTIDKTTCMICQTNATADGQMYLTTDDGDTLNLTTTSDLSTQIDDALSNTTIQITVYP